MVCASGTWWSRHPLFPCTTAYTSSRTSYSLLNRFAPINPEAPVTRIGPLRARIFDSREYIFLRRSPGRTSWSSGRVRIALEETSGSRNDRKYGFSHTNVRNALAHSHGQSDP